MRRAAFWWVVLALLISGCAGSSRYMTAAPPPASAPADKAVVYFLRPSGMGFAVNFQIWDRERVIGVGQAKSYFRYVAEPGNHLFMGIAENKVAVSADLEAGKAYHIVTSPRMGGFKARMAFEPVTKGSENWEKIEQIRAGLNYVEAKPEELAAWEKEHKQQALELVRFFETSPDRDKYMQRLSPADGR